MSSTSKRRFPFSILLSLETATHQLEPNLESTVDDLSWRCHLLLKTVTLEVKNVPACCCGEESMSSLSTTLLAPHGISKPFQHLHKECLINSGSFGTNSKWLIPLMLKKHFNIVLISHLA
jgi:hypothetical protein